jgi:hypothetical protein
MYVCVVASSNPQNQTKAESFFLFFATTKAESLLHDFHFLPKMRVYNNAKERTLFFLKRNSVGHTVKHIKASRSSKAALDQNSHIYGSCRFL